MSRPRGPHPAAAGLLPLLAVALYLGTLRSDFVWDDLELVVLNQYVHRLPDLAEWIGLTADQASFGAFAGALYRPGVLLSWALDAALWGTNPLGFHLTSVLLHGLTVWALYGLVRALSGRTDLAAVAALLFAVHPAHVEAVAWVAARADLWATLGLVVAARLYLALLRSRGARRVGLYLLALATMAMSLLCKESAVVLPALLLLLEWFPGERGGAGGPAWGPALLRTLPFWLLALGHLLFLSRPLQTFNPGLTPGGLLARLPGALESLARYVGLAAVPVGMRPFYDLPRPESLLDPGPALGAGLLCLGGLLLLRWGRREPLAAFGLGWFALALAPYLDLLAFSPRPMGLADRYLYAPLVGGALLAGWLLVRLAERLARPPRRPAGPILAGAAAALALAGIVSTALYLPVWRDNLSLYGRMVRDFPDAPQPHLNLGTTLLDLGEVEPGLAELETAVRLRPDWVRPQITLALALVATGDPARGFRIFDRIAEAAAGDHTYYLMRARAHLTAGEAAAAAAILGAGLRRFPASGELHLLLGRAREAAGDLPGAAAAYRAAAAHDPRLGAARQGLARVLGRPAGAEGPPPGERP